MGDSRGILMWVGHPGWEALCPPCLAYLPHIKCGCIHLGDKRFLKVVYWFRRSWVTGNEIRLPRWVTKALDQMIDLLNSFFFFLRRGKLSQWNVRNGNTASCFVPPAFIIFFNHLAKSGPFTLQRMLIRMHHPCHPRQTKVNSVLGAQPG